MRILLWPWHFLVSIALNMEARLISEMPSSEQDSFLRRRVKQFPFWVPGHMRIAELALSSRDVTLAYGAAQCVISLARNEAEKNKGSHLLARALLAGGEPDRALKALSSLSKHAQGDFNIQEDMIACLMALGRENEAIVILERVGWKNLSPEARAIAKHLTKNMRP